MSLIFLCILLYLGVDVIDVHKCSGNPCGKFYHIACLQESELDHLIPKVVSTDRTFVVHINT